MSGGPDGSSRSSPGLREFPRPESLLQRRAHRSRRNRDTNRRSISENKLEIPRPSSLPQPLPQRQHQRRRQWSLQSRAVKVALVCTPMCTSLSRRICTSSSACEKEELQKEGPEETRRSNARSAN